MKIFQKIKWVFSRECPCTVEEYNELKAKLRVAESMHKDAHEDAALFTASTDKLYQLITEAQDLEVLNRKASDVMKYLLSVRGHSYKPDYAVEFLWMHYMG